MIWNANIIRVNRSFLYQCGFIVKRFIVAFAFVYNVKIVETFSASSTCMCIRVVMGHNICPRKMTVLFNGTDKCWNKTISKLSVCTTE